VARHTVTPDGGHRAGPTLYRLFGRPAGGHLDYPYSAALQHSDLIWTEETVARRFEVGPDVMVPGSKSRSSACRARRTGRPWSPV
jgi:cytochrome c